MGGIILSYPLVRRVQEEYPDAKMFFLTFASNKSLLEVLKMVPAQNIVIIDDKSPYAFIQDAVSALQRIRKERIDVCFDLEFFSRFTAILSYLSGAAKRIGFYRYTLEGLYRGNLLTHNILYNPHLHMSQMFLCLGQDLEIHGKVTPELERVPEAIAASAPRFIPTQRQKEEMRDRLKGLGVRADARILFVNPGEGRLPLREWPWNNFVVLVRNLLELENHYILIVGTSGCSGRLRQFDNELKHERCINLSGKTSILELLTFLTMGAALIANDSGLVHLASLTSIQQFIFFGPESPRVFAPLGDHAHIFYSGFSCSPCFSAYNHRRSVCKDNRCLKVITPDEAYNVISKKIALEASIHSRQASSSE